MESSNKSNKRRKLNFSTFEGLDGDDETLSSIHDSQVDSPSGGGGSNEEFQRNDDDQEDKPDDAESVENKLDEDMIHVEDEESAFPSSSFEKIIEALENKLTLPSEMKPISEKNDFFPYKLHELMQNWEHKVQSTTTNLQIKPLEEKCKESQIQTFEEMEEKCKVYEKVLKLREKESQEIKHNFELERNIKKEIKAIKESHNRVKNALMQLSSLGQESKTAMSALQSITTTKISESMIVTDPDPGRQQIPVVEDIYKWVLDKKTKFPTEHRFHIDNLKLAQDKSKMHILSDLSSRYANYLMLTTKLERPINDKYKERIQEGLDLTFSDERMRRGTTFYSPGLCGQEVHGVEPVLVRIIREMLSSIACPSSSNLSPPESPKSMVCTKRPIVVENEVHTKRIPDLTIMKLGSFIYVMWSDSIQLCFEIKPTLRLSSTPDKLWKEAFIQVLSHLSKYCLQGWIMFGAGVDIHATGVVATMYGVEIVQMKAINPCSKDATIELLSTGELPLIDENTFKEWIKGANQNDFDKIHEILYKKEKYACGSPPPGWMGLWELFQCRSSELFHIPALEDGQQLLGWGTFGYVFTKSSEGPNKKIIKVPRFCRKNFLTKEEAAYKAIGEHDHLLKFESYAEDFQLNLGKFPFKIHSLTLSPICEKLVPTLVNESDKDERSQCMIKIITQCKDALDHIHSKGYTVNDISYENIMIHKSQPDGDICAKLIDFSNAEKLGTDMKIFSGTPPFVHQKVHLCPKTWVTSERIDLVGLAYVFAAMYQSLVIDSRKSCVIPWDESFLNGRVKEEGVLRERCCTALEIIPKINGLPYSWMIKTLENEFTSGLGTMQSKN